jgi:uncharacterized membrane protein SpoIIM required for sporulation
MRASQLVLKSAEFRRERSDSWRELDRLLAQIETRGFHSLSPTQIMRLPVLHRAAVSALSVARAISLDSALLRYLESLTSRSFFCVYGVKRHPREAARDFLVRRFPEIVRSFRWQLAVAALAFWAGVLTAFVLTRRDSDLYYSFVAEEVAQGRTPTTSTAELRAALYESETTASAALAYFSSFLFSHNAQIGITAFVLGFLGGVPAFVVLFVNGLSLGAMAALYRSRGLGLDFWCWVLPHGVTELLAIALCGGAGFVLGQSLVFPGRHARLVSLAQRGRRAGQVALGCVLMFFLAALVEGFFRQLVTSLPVRAATALATAGLWALYFGLAGRRHPA